MYRVVADPNMLISAAIARGNPHRVVDLAASGLVTIVASPLLMEELRKVLARDRFLRWRTREELDRFVTDIEQLVEHAPDPADVPAVCRDPHDDYLVALLHETGADALCSGDQDLHAVEGITVWSPAALVQQVLGQP
jgi:putative PIN family toxin of toxin-antitoxin system